MDLSAQGISFHPREKRTPGEGKGDCVWEDGGRGEFFGVGGDLAGRAAEGRKLPAVDLTGTAHACPGPTADPTSPRTGAGAGGMWLQQHLGATKPVATPAPANPYPSHCALLQASSSKGQRLPSCTHTSLGSTGSRQLWPCFSLQELLGTPWGCSPAFCSKKACAGASSGCSCHPPPPVES